MYVPKLLRPLSVAVLLVSGLVVTTTGTAASVSPSPVVAGRSVVSVAAPTPCTRVRFAPSHRIATRYAPNASPLNRHRFAATFNVTSNCPQLNVYVRQQGKSGLKFLRAVPPGTTRVALPEQQPWQRARYRLIGEHADFQFRSGWKWVMRMKPTGYTRNVNTPSAKPTKELFVSLDVGVYVNGDNDYSAIYSNVRVLLRSGQVVAGRPEFASETGAVADITGLGKAVKVANGKLVNRRRTVAFSISRLRPYELNRESQFVVGKTIN